MSWSHSATFYEQIAVSLSAGLTIAQALPLAGDVAGGEVRTQARRWSDGCAKGQGLAEQLAQARVPSFDVALIKAAEKSGRLPELCRELAAQCRHRIELRNLVIGKLVYPVVLIHVALLALGIVLCFWSGWSPWTIIALPVLLWLLVGSAWLAFGLVGGATRARLAISTPLAPLTLPLVAANTATVLRAGLSAGMLMPDALELAAGACGNQVLGSRLISAGNELRYNRLHALADALARSGLPPLVVSHVTSGEKSGKLDETLRQVATLMRESFRLRAEWTARIACGVIYGTAMLGAVAVVLLFFSSYVGLINDTMKDL